MNQHPLPSFVPLKADQWNPADHFLADLKPTSLKDRVSALGVIFLRRTCAQDPDQTMSRRFQMSPIIRGMPENSAHGAVRHG